MDTPDEEPSIPETLRELASVIAAKKSHNTMRAYSCDWRLFRAWCEIEGISALPAHSSDVARYLRKSATRKNSDGSDHYRITTLQGYVTAIDHYHAEACLPEPGREPLVRETMKYLGLVMTRRARQWLPLMRKDIQTIVSSFDFSTAQKAHLAYRDACLLMLGFAGGFRRSELVNVKLQDLRFEDRGLEILVPKSKTDQVAAGMTKGAYFTQEVFFCVPCWVVKQIMMTDAIKSGGAATEEFVRSMNSLGPANHVCKRANGIVRRSNEFLFHPFPTSKPIFTARAMRGEDVHHMVRARMAPLAYDVHSYGAHSLRIGLVTQALDNKASKRDVMRQTGHKTESMIARYDRGQDALSNDAVQNLWGNRPPV